MLTASEATLRSSVYLAARYSRRLEMLEVRADLERAGYHITSRWINGAHQADFDRETPEGTQIMARFAEEDLEDLRKAEYVVSFQEIPRQPTTNRGGRHVEFGVALALRKQLIAVGPLEHVFTALPSIERFPVWEDALDYFQRVRREQIKRELRYRYRANSWEVA